jgi:NAD(P)H-flavin reductase
MPFMAGSFVNLFIMKDGEKLRRAFSISSSEASTKEITLSIRHNPSGAVTPLFWQDDIVGTKVDLMGPLGLNTADKMQSGKILLFGFGIGAGVIKSLAEHFVHRPTTTNLTIVTGNRSESELLHKDYLDTLATDNKNVTIKYVVSDQSQEIYPLGYIQNHISEYDFNNADVYICGQTVACEALEKKIKNTNPYNCQFFVEDFH